MMQAYTTVDLSQIVIDPSALKLLSKESAKRHLALPLSRNAQQLTLAMSRPDNIIALDQIRAQLQPACHINIVKANEQELLQTIERCYDVEWSIDGILHEILPDHMEVGIPAVPGLDNNQPVVRLINALLHDAVQNGASDVHFEPEPHFLRVRYRIDGVLHPMRSIAKHCWPAMLVRIKVMSNMNIAETRAPQDGRISLQLAGRPIDFRVASHPTTAGENLVLRILDRQKGIVPLSQLGLEPDTLQSLQHIINKPEGLVLVTGPTGSGKTTTLYSVLNHLNTDAVNIMTLEDPVEYPIERIRQTSLNETAKLDFAQGIRSMMRQDPDIILVGEIRDLPTAEMAFRAAMTGHQVYTTLHSNSAIGAIPRLLDIGILPDIMAGNINGIIAQRLVRKLCPHCKIAHQPDADEQPLLGNIPLIYRAQGCVQCAGRGYLGRMALMELLAIDEELDELITQRASARHIRHCAHQQGFRPLVRDGLRRVLQGITSLDEVRRVVDLSDRKH